eukprot:GFYU01001948.1.p1 GENE.GFYU01001948.1~~GFYU01001948.1.p1  ORF type:complete len:2213 (-),score=873.22 GFYU01001948.1:199-6837(-)
MPPQNFSTDPAEDYDDVRKAVDVSPVNKMAFQMEGRNLLKVACATLMMCAIIAFASFSGEIHVTTSAPATVSNTAVTSASTNLRRNLADATCDAYSSSDKRGLLCNACSGVATTDVCEVTGTSPFAPAAAETVAGGKVGDLAELVGNAQTVVFVEEGSLVCATIEPTGQPTSVWNIVQAYLPQDVVDAVEDAAALLNININNTNQSLTNILNASTNVHLVWAWEDDGTVLSREIAYHAPGTVTIVSGSLTVDSLQVSLKHWPQTNDIEATATGLLHVGAADFDTTIQISNNGFFMEFDLTNTFTVGYILEDVLGLTIDNNTPLGVIAQIEVVDLNVIWDNTVLPTYIDIGFNLPPTDVGGVPSMEFITGKAFVKLDYTDPNDPDIAYELDFGWDLGTGQADVSIEGPPFTLDATFDNDPSQPASSMVPISSQLGANVGGFPFLEKLRLDLLYVHVAFTEPALFKLRAEPNVLGGIIDHVTAAYQKPGVLIAVAFDTQYVDEAVFEVTDNQQLADDIEAIVDALPIKMIVAEFATRDWVESQLPPDCIRWPVSTGITLSIEFKPMDPCTSWACQNILNPFLAYNPVLQVNFNHGDAQLTLTLFIQVNMVAGPFTFTRMGLEAAIGGSQGWSLMLFADAKVTVDQNPLTELDFRFQMGISKVTFSIGAQLVGRWVNAFGIPKFTIGNLLLEINIGLAQGGIPGFEFQGEMILGDPDICLIHQPTTNSYALATGPAVEDNCVRIRGAIGLDAVDSYVYAEIENLTFGTLLNIFWPNGPTLPAILDDGIRYAIFSFAVTEQTLVDGTPVPAGIQFQADLLFLGMDVSMGVIFNYNPFVFDAYLTGPAINWGGILTLTRSSTNLSEGPHFHLLINDSGIAIDASIYMELFSLISAEAELSFRFAGADSFIIIEVSADLGPFSGSIRIEGSLGSFRRRRLNAYDNAYGAGSDLMLDHPSNYAQDAKDAMRALQASNDPDLSLFQLTLTGEFGEGLIREIFNLLSDFFDAAGNMLNDAADAVGSAADDLAATEPCGNWYEKCKMKKKCKGPLKFICKGWKWVRNTACEGACKIAEAAFLVAEGILRVAEGILNALAWVADLFMAALRWVGDKIANLFDITSVYIDVDLKSFTCGSFEIAATGRIFSFKQWKTVDWSISINFSFGNNCPNRRLLAAEPHTDGHHKADAYHSYDWGINHGEESRVKKEWTGKDAGRRFLVENLDNGLGSRVFLQMFADIVGDQAEADDYLAQVCGAVASTPPQWVESLFPDDFSISVECGADNESQVLEDTKNAQIAIFQNGGVIVDCPSGPGLTVTALDKEEWVNGNQCTRIIRRQWSAMDDCNNIVKRDQIISYVDTQGPLWEVEMQDADTDGDGNPIPPEDREGNDDPVTLTPGEITIKCEDWPVDFSDIIFVDRCQASPDPFLVSAEPDANADIFGCQTRTVTTVIVAEDACGNQSSFTQVMNIIDDTPPFFTFFPSDAAVSEFQPFGTDALGFAQAMDGCNSNGVEITYSDSVTQQGPEDCIETVIVRTWTATDACGNAFSQPQNIIIRRTERAMGDASLYHAIVDGHLANNMALFYGGQVAVRDTARLASFHVGGGDCAYTENSLVVGTHLMWASGFVYNGRAVHGMTSQTTNVLEYSPLQAVVEPDIIDFDAAEQDIRDFMATIAAGTFQAGPVTKLCFDPFDKTPPAAHNECRVIEEFVGDSAVAVSGNDITLSGTSYYNFFELTTDQLLGDGTILIDVPDNAYTLVNVAGTSMIGTPKHTTIVNEGTGANVLWTFPEATALTVTGRGTNEVWEGTIVALDAFATMVAFTNRGQMFVKAMDSVDTKSICGLFRANTLCTDVPNEAQPPCDPMCGTGLYWATGTCDHNSGECVCQPGWTGPACNLSGNSGNNVGDGTNTGAQCHPDCGTGIYWSTGTCLDNGECECAVGWGGDGCSVQGGTSTSTGNNNTGNNNGNNNQAGGNCVPECGTGVYWATGTCVNDVCQCTQGWTGLGCNEPSTTAGTVVTTGSGSTTCDPVVCGDNSSHGYCAGDECRCYNGWTGDTCTTEVVTPTCDERCGAGAYWNTGSCDTATGTCTCIAGWGGVACQVQVAPGTECDPAVCGGSAGTGTCINQVCECDDGFEGVRCDAVVGAPPYACPANSWAKHTGNPPSAFVDCECNWGFIRNDGNESCDVNTFSCPANSYQNGRNSPPLTIDDCDCYWGHVKSGDQCVRQ